MQQSAAITWSTISWTNWAVKPTRSSLHSWSSIWSQRFQLMNLSIMIECLNSFRMLWLRLSIPPVKINSKLHNGRSWCSKWVGKMFRLWCKCLEVRAWRFKRWRMRPWRELMCIWGLKLSLCLRRLRSSSLKLLKLTCLNQMTLEHTSTISVNKSWPSNKVWIKVPKN